MGSLEIGGDPSLTNPAQPRNVRCVFTLGYRVIQGVYIPVLAGTGTYPIFGVIHFGDVIW